MGEFFSDASKNGLMNTIRDAAWPGDDMRMMKADVEDLQGFPFTGTPDQRQRSRAELDWLAFEPGERIRLRYDRSSTPRP